MLPLDCSAFSKKLNSIVVSKVSSLKTHRNVVNACIDEMWQLICRRIKVKMNVTIHRDGTKTKLVFYERREGTTQPFIAFLNKILLDTLSWVADDIKKS